MAVLVLTNHQLSSSSPPGHPAPTAWPHSRMLWTKASQMGAKVFYECDVGYYNAGPENISVCTVDGVWSPPNVVCQGIAS